MPPLYRLLGSLYVSQRRQPVGLPSRRRAVARRPAWCELHTAQPWSQPVSPVPKPPIKDPDPAQSDDPGRPGDRPTHPPFDPLQDPAIDPLGVSPIWRHDSAAPDPVAKIPGPDRTADAQDAVYTDFSVEAWPSEPTPDL